ncbi:protein N-terminal glutamine amidohydrolase [Thalassophryne amazonica]|uniref:protein N-terminal glutamine amidohydrolase n=1 Tax=Thalassophryne amazonica TaxID=390379 RepID=UPI001472638B|nr:protein N-terminal glutamine amidohydrolase [Thalassophryne amazonica]XP_034016583.1 protein N-terminal glutamine amidohydrolase [Thalassophryne amazonica]
MTSYAILPKRENCVYTSCYCEENVWKLCEFVRTEGTTGLDQVFVVFISNDKRMVPLWKQKSGYGDQPVIWDYHVILLHVSHELETLVYDLDSVLMFPCSLQLYADQALRSDRGIKPAYHRKLRVIPADVFLQNFASDRSHMKDSSGAWQMPPPPYSPIQTAESKMNLDDFISMDPGVGWGRVFTLDGFLKFYTRNPSVSS